MNNIQQSTPDDGRGTDAQIERERDIARHAIVGALAAGYAGAAHPGAEHWLAAAHDAGARIKALEAAAHAKPEPLPAHADRVPEIAERLRLVARLAGVGHAIPVDDEIAVGCIFPVLGYMSDALERKQRAAPEPVGEHQDGWLQDGGLLYRLTDERSPQNRDEINVTMANGSRTQEARARRAGELLDRIRGGYQQAAAELRELMGDERATFEQAVARMPAWAPEYEQHRPWVNALLWFIWHDCCAMWATRLRGAVPEITYTPGTLHEVKTHDELKAFFLSSLSCCWTPWPDISSVQAVPMTWPTARDVGRYGDMSPEAHLRVGLDSDNDVFVSVSGDRGTGSVEFCNGAGGGGSSMRTREALIALMVAIEADNAKRPDKDFWKRRG